MSILPPSRHGYRAAAAVLTLMLALVPTTRGDPVTKARVLVQTALVAGLRHYEAKAVWDRLQPGDALALVREPANPHDPNAVRIDWDGHALGYLPQSDNVDIARQLDRGQALEARIAKLALYRNHRRKLEIEIFIGL
ncbi:MAG: HIRAN domain-containing protein [Betaproteobacteria bacterium]